MSDAIAEQLHLINRHLNRIAQRAPFSQAKLQVLQLICRGNPVTLKQLAKLQAVSMPTMSKLVDELQNDSLVIRAHSKDDARQRWIVPTQKGLTVFDQATRQTKEFWQQQLSGLGSSDIAQIEESLALLLEKLQDDKPHSPE